MSGIYISGMEMPTSCEECVLKSVTGVDRWKCRVLNAEFMSWDAGWGGEKTRRENCPLVPVSPHGDLIDRDKLEKDIDKYIGGEESRSRFHHWVQVQDAVIPMDKGGEK